MLAEHELDRREHLRVRPSFLTPVVFEWDGRDYRIMDISRGGFSFVNQVPLDNGWQLLGCLRLPQEDLPMEVKVVVVGNSEEGLVRCMIEEISPANLEILSHYIRDRSKELTSLFFKELAQP